MDLAPAYALLGLPLDATVDEVRVAFRSVVMSVHPDLVGDEGTSATALLLDAYQLAMQHARDSEVQQTQSTTPQDFAWLIDRDTIALRASRFDAFVRMVEVGQRIGAITYLDREGELLEVLLRTKLGDSVSLVISFQGRNDWVEAFLTTEPLDKPRHELPTTEQITELVLHHIQNG